MSPHPAPNFHASHWQAREAWQTSWHALETSFGCGESFLHTLQAWRHDANAPSTLFFTAFTADTPEITDPLLGDACFGLLPGLHRIVFENGKVQLTLCIGQAPGIAREIDIAADSIQVDTLDAWGGRNLTRLCKRGTAIAWAEGSAAAIAEFKQLGMAVHHASKKGTYHPAWAPKSALRPSPSATFKQMTPHANQHAVIIGSGLSGAAVAHSLAIRGWTVDVLDQGEALGAGASGLPAGIFATHVSPDNNVLSRITRDGVRATIQRARQLLKQGAQWQVSHLLEHRYAGKRQLPTGAQWPAAGHEWTTEANAAHKQAGGLLESTDALWHTLAGWVQTPALVKAQLTHPNITWRGHCKVAKLEKADSHWLVLDHKKNILAQGKHVVLATAHQCQALLDTVECPSYAANDKRPYLPATGLRGQVTWGTMAKLPPHFQQRLPSFPVNGHGSYIGHLQLAHCNSDEACWIVGASFQRNDFDLNTRHADLQSNIQQWAELMPALAAEIQQGVDLTQTQSWASLRSALPDRLPAVGAFQHPHFTGLQVCTGMGARGISWSVLCGELLAAQLNHEPLPMAASLAKLMSASRFG